MKFTIYKILKKFVYTLLYETNREHNRFKDVEVRISLLFCGICPALCCEILQDGSTHSKQQNNKHCLPFNLLDIDSALYD